MNIIIVGCGRVGAELALLLSQNEHNITVIDRQQSAFRNLGSDFNGRVIKGTGFDEAILRQAGALECDVLAAVTSEDNANLMTSEIARKIFHIDRVVTRLYNPDSSEVYAQLGIDFICGTTLLSEGLYAKIESGIKHHLDTFGDFEILTFTLDTDDKTVRLDEITDNRDVKFLAVEHEGTSMLPRDSTMLHTGDKVIAAVREDYIPQFRKYIRE